MSTPPTPRHAILAPHIDIDVYRWSPYDGPHINGPHIDDSHIVGSDTIQYRIVALSINR